MLSHVDLIKGVYFLLEGQPHEVLENSHMYKGRGSSVMQTKLRNMKTGNVVNNLIQTKHSYPSVGTFTLTITITDGISSDTDTVIITIVPFTVKIITDKERDKFPQIVKFDTKIDGGKAPFTFDCDFNEDGITDSTQNKPTSSFNEGTFDVLLKVTDADGDVSTGTLTLKVAKIESMPRKIAHINSIKFDNEFVKAGDNIELFINFENKGNFHIQKFE
ncbi:hypothetical protein IIC68_04035 [archaeon]|nr:hypothetical protein [archaeon]